MPNLFRHLAVCAVNAAQGRDDNETFWSAPNVTHSSFDFYSVKFFSVHPSCYSPYLFFPIFKSVEIQIAFYKFSMFGTCHYLN